MAVGLIPPSRLYPVRGVRLGTAKAGVRYPDRADLVVLEIAEGATAAGVFTRNAFCAAPVIVGRRHLNMTAPRYLLINAGNANAGTGTPGIADALACCQCLAESTGCAVEAVLPFSTGVIGERLPVDRIRAALPEVLAALDEDAWIPAAQAIMTTDTVPKGVSRRIEADGRAGTITGIAKGAGMIRPDMATLLAFLATDLRVSDHVLREALHEAVGRSFNRITVDGDTSTNDTCMLIATGGSEMAPIEKAEGPGYAAFRNALDEVCTELAQAIVRDAEGATKFITVAVSEGGDEAECLQVAYTIAHSPLVKTACFAGDPNWGRILAAVGRSGLVGLDTGRVGIVLNGVSIVEAGARADGYTEEAGQRAMASEDIVIAVALGRGSAEASVWTSDLSHEYVRINAEYRT